MLLILALACGSGAVSQPVDTAVDTGDSPDTGSDTGAATDTGTDPDTGGSTIADRVWWPDHDGDGFGWHLGKVIGKQPEGFVDNADDCDDADSWVHGRELRYYDDDGDNWGGFAAYLCEQDWDGTMEPERKGDCDDTDPRVYPGEGCPEW